MGLFKIIYLRCFYGFFFLSDFVSIPDQPHQLNLEDLEYNPEEHEYGLLPPPLHVGEFQCVFSVIAVSGSCRATNQWFCRNSSRLSEEDEFEVKKTKEEMIGQ